MNFKMIAVAALVAVIATPVLAKNKYYPVPKKAHPDNWPATCRQAWVPGYQDLWVGDYIWGYFCDSSDGPDFQGAMDNLRCPIREVQRIHNQLVCAKECENTEINPHQEITAPSTWVACTGYRFVFTTSGNFVVQGSDGAQLYTTTLKHAIAHTPVLAMQSDGNLVIYDRDVKNNKQEAVWSSETAGSGAHLSLQRDGNAVLYVGRTPIWDTKTAEQ